MTATTPLTIVVPTDFSDCSRAALARALELAARLDGEVVLAHVADTSGLYVGAMDLYLDVAGISADIQAHVRRELERVADAADPERRLIRRIVVAEGRPAEGIADVAREEAARLVVMGTHGRSGLSGLPPSVGGGLRPPGGSAAAPRPSARTAPACSTAGNSRVLSRLVLGSVAERVVRTAPCDVLVVRAGAPEPAAAGAPGGGAGASGSSAAAAGSAA